MVARNTILSLLGRALPLVATLILLPAIVHGLGTDRYGAFSLAWQLVGYSTLFELGVGLATTKFVAEAIGEQRESRVPSIVIAAIAIETVAGVAGAVLLYAAVPFATVHVLRIPPWLASEVRTMLRVTVSGIPIVLWTGIFQGLLAAYQRFDLISATSVLTGVGSLIVAYAVIASGGKLPLVIGSMFGVRALVLAFLVIASCRLKAELLEHVRLPDRDILRRFASFGTWLSAPKVLQAAVAPVERILVVRLVGLEALTYYSVPADILSRFGFINTSLGSVLFPTFATLHAAGNRVEARRLFDRSVRLLWLMAWFAMGFVFVFADDLLRYWIGPAIALQAALPLRVMVVGLAINMPCEIPFQMLQASGRVDLPAKVDLATIPFDMLLAYVLIRIWGINGAAMSTTSECIIMSVSLFVFTRRLYGLPSTEAVRAALPVVFKLVILLAIAFIIHAFAPEALWPRLATMGSLIVGFTVLLWVWGLAEDDRSTVKSVAHRFGHLLALRA